MPEFAFPMALRILDDAGFGAYAMVSAAIVSFIQLLATAATASGCTVAGEPQLVSLGFIRHLVVGQRQMVRMILVQMPKPIIPYGGKP